MYHSIARLRSLTIGTLVATALLTGCSNSGKSVAKQSESASADTGSAADAGAMDHSMHNMEVTSEFSFLTQMIPHHEEAVTSASALKARTKRPELQKFAAIIVDTQTAEIAGMKANVAAWYPGKDTTVTYMPMMSDVTDKTDDDADRAFLEDMKGHHQSAVTMAETALALPDLHPETKTLAENIISAQNAEIAQISAWLTEWYGATADTKASDHSGHA